MSHTLKSKHKVVKQFDSGQQFNFFGNVTVTEIPKNPSSKQQFNFYGEVKESSRPLKRKPADKVDS